MGKFYKLLVFAAIAILFHSSVFSQIVANNDVFDNFNYSSGVTVDILANDTLNGNPITASQVVLTQIGGSSGVSLSGTSIFVSFNLPPGTYSLIYKICVPNSTDCDTASVIINTCALSQPTVLATPDPTCSAPPSITLGNLPATGTWTLITHKPNAPDLYTTGTGTTTTLSLTTGNYSFRVKNEAGCSSGYTAQVYFGHMNSNTMDTSLAATYQDTDNNGAINVGDYILYQLSVTNLLDCPIHLNVHSSGMTFIDNTADINPAATDGSITAYHPITQAEINSGQIGEWIAVSGLTEGGSAIYEKAFRNLTLNIPDGIKLNPFFDTNNNGTQDAGEPSFGGGYFSYQINGGANVHNLYSQAGSMVLYETNGANSYDITYNLNGYSYCDSQYSIPAPTISNITVIPGSGITTYNFPITGAPCTDFWVSLSGSAAQPGFLFRNRIYYGNAGNMAIPSGTVTFTKDNLLAIDSINNPAAVVNPAGFTYDFTNLQANETRMLELYLQVPPIPTVNLGDLLTNTAQVSVPETDLHPENNTDAFTRVIGGSYDPNDITESHGGQILFSGFGPSDYLTYTIRFENTGTASAFKVSVTDLLSDKLDGASIRMVAASHPYLLDRVGNNLQWKFDGIRLPPSVTGTQTGKGFIVFQVKPKAGYQVGDIIPNAAAIYFDFNPAVNTNTFDTEFTAPLSTPDFRNADFRVWPNPVKDKLNIDLGGKNIGHISVAAVSGKIVLEKTINAPKATLDLSRLSVGMYFVKVKSDGSEKTVKIVKE